MTPEHLMRARYAAFAQGLASFVMETTSPAGAAFETDASAWQRSIQAFSDQTRFVGLEVLAVSEAGAEGQVEFRATLDQGGRDASFTERSRFVRVDGRWLYDSGTIL